jgi:hypothetical protein
MSVLERGGGIVMIDALLQPMLLIVGLVLINSIDSQRRNKVISPFQHMPTDVSPLLLRS